MFNTVRLLGVACTLSLTAGGSAVHAAPAQAPGFSFIKSLDGIDEYKLDANGLSVLVKPDHSAPVVTFQVTYRVGSRNEVTGTTGATHILEHLMFKGTEEFNDPKGNSVKQYLGKVGAGFNASTGTDRTNYYATLGKDSLEGYIAIESDRMRHLWLHDADRNAEMTVVRNEYEQGENDPNSALYKEVVATAYQALPYHHSTIGWRSDIEKVPTSKLKDFYDTFYWPDNATVTIVGDVEPAKALGLVRKYYGEIPHSPGAIPEMYTEEPAQTGPRRIIVKRAGELGSLIVAYKGPNGRDSDLPALSVAAAVLSLGENSRLSRALTDKSLTTFASADIQPTHDPGLFMVSAGLAPNAKHDEVEKIMLAEIGKLKKEGVSADEVSQVVNQYRAAQAYGRDGTAGTAAAINEWIAVGDWTLFVTFVDSVSKVTPEDVKRVANQYLNEDQSTTGWFVPAVSQ